MVSLLTNDIQTVGVTQHSQLIWGILIPVADNLLLTKCGLHYTLDLHFSIVTVDGITVYRNGLYYKEWFSKF